MRPINGPGDLEPGMYCLKDDLIVGRELVGRKDKRYVVMQRLGGSLLLNLDQSTVPLKFWNAICRALVNLDGSPIA